MNDKVDKEKDSGSESGNSARSEFANEAYNSMAASARSSDVPKTASVLPELTLEFSGKRSSKTSDTDPAATEKLSPSESKAELNDPHRGIADAATSLDRADWLRNPANLDPISLKTIWHSDSRVLAIGDDHPSMGIKQWTEGSLKDLAAQGATAFAMEFLPRSSQGLLDHYASLRRNGSTEEAAKARMLILDQIVSQQRGPNETPDEKMEKPLQFQMKLVDAAIDAGMRPLAIEPHISGMWVDDAGFDFMHKGMEKLPGIAQSAFDRFTSVDSSEVQRDQARKELEQHLRQDKAFAATASKWLDEIDNARREGLDFSGMKLPATSSEFPDKLWDDKTQDLRNRTWAAAANDYLKSEPNSRLVMFSGAGHFKYGENQVPLGKISSANEYLFAAGHKTTVLQFAGADYAKAENYETDKQNMNAAYWRTQPESGVVPNQDGKWPDAPDAAFFYQKRWTDAANDAGVDQKSFAVKIANTGARQADWVIHLKQDRSGRK